MAELFWLALGFALATFVWRKEAKEWFNNKIRKKQPDKKVVKKVYNEDELDDEYETVLVKKKRTDSEKVSTKNVQEL